MSKQQLFLKFHVLGPSGTSFKKASDLNLVLNEASQNDEKGGQTERYS